MQNPFNHENYPSNVLKRNTFPCSFQNNLTMKYGYIYPAGIWRTVPGATYKIKPTLGLNFMPTTFPVQTRQKVYVHYFYGRDRNFWKDYKDFVNGQRPDLVKPYIDESVTKARTGKLLDYLGVPTTLVGNYGSYELDSTSADTTDGLFKFFTLDGVSDFVCPTRLDGDSTIVQFNTNSPIPDFSKLVGLPLSNLSKSYTRTGTSLVDNIVFGSYFPHTYNKNFDSIHIRVGSTKLFLHTYINDALNFEFPSSKGFQDTSYNYTAPIPRERYRGTSIFALAVIKDSIIDSIINVSSLGDNGDLVFKIADKDNIDGFLFLMLGSYSAHYGPDGLRNINVFTNFDTTDSNGTITINDSYLQLGDLRYYGSTGLVHDIDDTTSPYWRSGVTTDLRERIKLNAYLPRFYETVYNLYYRNPQNNPYFLDGRPEYNKFIPSKDGGVDSNLYELRRRNWEDDFLTTAVQSPQQGIAPLVGLTDRGATLTLTNDDGSVTRYNVTTTDNGSITGIEANDTNAEPVLTKALIDAVSYGISIEDIRNVNAMQKWLELNLRKGYQYKDIIQARWGISISYNELDLPEFIGGFTKDVQLQAVTQTANVSDDVTGQLGWQAGRLFASGEGREITHYCDEEGYIMCLISVVPVPNYSQLLPKHWFERDLLDSYQPEFNHIGFQPITYKEVCPVQAYQESSENINALEQTFGYQRPWYQYFNYTDEVHGQFRTTFKDFLINRVFDVKPELSESFLLVDPEQINDVFNVPDADDDKIIGAIYHNCVAKLPISLYAQARLE